MRRPSAEFWDLTYREIFACVKAYSDEQKHASRERRILYGTLAAAPHNALAAAGKLGKNPTFKQWSDVFPDYQTEEQVRFKNAEQIRLQFQIAHAAFRRSNPS